MKQDTVIIVSDINTFEKTESSPSDKLDRLLNVTIPNVVKHFPNAFIIVIEDSEISVEYRNKIKIGCDLLLNDTGNNRLLPKVKSFRDMYSMSYALYFTPQCTERLIKLDARYDWTDTFNVSKFSTDKMNMLYQPHANMYDTRSFVISGSANIMNLVNVYNAVLKTYQSGNLRDTDIEVSSELQKYNSFINRISFEDFGISRCYN